MSWSASCARTIALRTRSVIFCSASYHEREVREMARSLGVQSTLAKPFDLKTVRTTVDAAFALAATRRCPMRSRRQRRRSSAERRSD